MSSMISESGSWCSRWRRRGIDQRELSELRSLRRKSGLTKRLCISIIPINHTELVGNGGEEMCEIYAYAGKRAGSFVEELREFFSHSGEHPNGWGLAVEKDVTAILFRL